MTPIVRGRPPASRARRLALDADLVIASGGSLEVIEIKPTSVVSEQDLARIGRIADLLGARRATLITRASGAVRTASRWAVSLGVYLERCRAAPASCARDGFEQTLRAMSESFDMLLVAALTVLGVWEGAVAVHQRSWKRGLAALAGLSAAGVLYWLHHR